MKKKTKKILVVGSLALNASICTGYAASCPNRFDYVQAHKNLDIGDIEAAYDSEKLGYALGFALGIEDACNSGKLTCSADIQKQIALAKSGYLRVMACANDQECVMDRGAFEAGMARGKQYVEAKLADGSGAFVKFTEADSAGLTLGDFPGAENLFETLRACLR